MKTQRCLTLLAALLAWTAPGRSDEAAATPQGPAIEAVAAKLPAPVGDAARKWLHADDRELRSLTAFSPADLEQQVMVALASEPGAADFVLGRMGAESAATDKLVLKVIAVDAFWVDQPVVVAGLQKLAESESDPDMMLAYLDAERRIEAKRLRRVLTARIEAARKSGDTKVLADLAAADERWVMLERGASIPGYLRRPPAVFTLKAPNQAIRVVGMGDFGSGTQEQRDVAAAIVRMGRAQAFDFGLTFGDNFYPSGMTGTDDRRWRDWWETLYSPLGITFYPSLGNHEWFSGWTRRSPRAPRAGRWSTAITRSSPPRGTPSPGGTWSTCRRGCGPSSGAGSTPTSAATSMPWRRWSPARVFISS
jgi:tartrate-resistant acid phosphatase type 5